MLFRFMLMSECLYNWCICYCFLFLFVFFFKQKTAYEMRISDWSSDVCSSDLRIACTSVPETAFCNASATRTMSRRLPLGRRARPGLNAPNTNVGSFTHRRRGERDRSTSSGQKIDRKSTRLSSVTNAQLVCRLLLAKKNHIYHLIVYTTKNITT